MNAYTVEFFAKCPTDQARIKYKLRIESRAMLMAETIIDALELIEEGYHEEIADDLLNRFGGMQTLVAEHHGVLIETTRATTKGSRVAGK